MTRLPPSTCQEFVHAPVFRSRVRESAGGIVQTSLPSAGVEENQPQRSHEHGSGKHAAGFTLLELLIAVAIFAVVLAAINGVFYGAMRLQRSSSRSVEESLPIQQALAIIKRDLQGLVAPGG